MNTATPPPPPALKWGLALTSLVVSLVAAEAVVRIATGSAFRQLPLYADDDAVGLTLRPTSEGILRAPGGHVTTVHTDALGLRPTGAEGPAWWVIGDSQVLGLGVEDDETFAAQLTAAGTPTRAVGVPGYGVEDALRWAHDRLPDDALGVVFVVNQANDAFELGHPVETRFDVAGSWLLPEGTADGLRGAFFSSPLSRVHLLHHLVVLASASAAALPAPAWGDDTTALATIGTLLRDATFPVPMLVLYLPVDIAATADRVDASPYRDQIPPSPPWVDDRPQQALSASLGRDGILVTPALRNPQYFLDRDYHLSAAGHAEVARSLAGFMERATAVRHDTPTPPPAPVVTP